MIAAIVFAATLIAGLSVGYRIGTANAEMNHRIANWGGDHLV